MIGWAIVGASLRDYRRRIVDPAAPPAGSFLAACFHGHGHAGLTNSRPFLVAEAIIRFTSSSVIGGGDAERSVVG